LLANLIDAFYKVPYTIELTNPESIRYLKDGASQKYKDCGFQFWPMYVSGNVFFSSLLDSLLPMVHHNDAILRVFNSMYEHHKHSFIQEDQEQEANDTITQNKELHMINIPAELEGSTYGVIMETLVSLENPILPLGLYTARFVNKPAQEDEHTSKIKTMGIGLEEPILITNPLPSTVISRGDKLLVLGHLINRERKFEKKTMAILVHAMDKLLFDDHELEEMFTVQLKNKSKKVDHNEVADEKEKFIQGCLVKRMVVREQGDKLKNEKELMIEQLKNSIKELKECETLKSLNTYMSK